VEYRFRDKLYLSNYTLDTGLFDLFDFLVEDAAPIRSVYILTTDKGVKILKKMDYPLEELLFLYEALKVVREEYPYVIKFRESIHGRPYVEYKGGIYTVLDLIDGRDCVVENPIDLRKASSALARLHKAGERVDMNCPGRNNLGRMPERYIKKIEEMKKYKEIALMHVNKSSFDELYLDYADYYIECAEKALEFLNNSPYKILCEKKHTLCHHDLAHHNMLIDKDENVHFVDFDYGIIDLPYHDISNIIVKSIKHIEWNTDVADNIVDAYSEENPLDKDELKVLLAFFSE
jgi:CotS family spore coat protein